MEKLGMHGVGFFCLIAWGVWMMANSHRYSFAGGLVELVLAYLVGAVVFRLGANKTI